MATALRKGLNAAWTGLTTPSPPATALMILIAGVIWVLLWFGFGPRHVARWGDHLAENPRDSYAFTTSRLACLDELVEPGVPTAIVTGASGVRYAIGDFAALEDELRTHVAGARVVDLTTDDQSVLETLAILDLIPDRFGGIVVVGTNPHRWSRPAAQRDPEAGFVYRLGVRSPYLDHWRALNGEPPRPEHSYFWDNREFLLPRLGPLIANTLDAPPDEFVPRAHNPRRAPDARWEAFARTVETIEERFATRGQPNLQLLAHAGRRFGQRTAGRLALLESPLAPRAARECYGPEFLALYDARMRRFAARQGWPYWTLQEAAELEEDDFFDWMHLRNGAARARFRTQLALRLAACR